MDLEGTKSKRRREKFGEANELDEQARKRVKTDALEVFLSITETEGA